MKWSNFLGPFIYGSLGIGILLTFVGVISGSRIIQLVAATAMVPFCLAIAFMLLGGIWIQLDSFVPEFKGKDIVVGAVALFVAGLVIYLVLIGNYDNGNCASYRGELLC